MIDWQDSFTIDDEAVYWEWLWLSWSHPAVTHIGVNLEPEPSCPMCAMGRCHQRIQSSDSWGADHIIHHYDALCS